MIPNPEPGREMTELYELAQLWYRSAISEIPWAVSKNSTVSVRFSLKSKGQFLRTSLFKKNAVKNSATWVLRLETG